MRMSSGKLAKNTSLLNLIKVREVGFLGHVIRKEKLEHLSDTHIYNSFIKAPTLLSMMCMTKKHGKRLE